MPRRSNSDQQRDEFYATFVNVLGVTAANADHARGKPIAILSLAKGPEIEQPLGISLRDAKLVVTKLLIVLATYKDQFARDLLDENFSAGEDGFVWPADGNDGHNSG